MPILVWSRRRTAASSSTDRIAFAPAVPAEPGDGLPPSPTIARGVESALCIGSHVDAVDLDAATRLASLRPADIGSGAADLGSRIEDDQGFVLARGRRPGRRRSGSTRRAIRTTELIPGQVRLLHSFLAGREATVATILLADDRNGT